MKRRINPFVVLYLLVIFLPLAIVATILTAIITIIMSTLFGDHKWGYYPAMVWSRVICALALIRVHIVGEENYDPNESYIFVANHQSILDIFLIYGWLDSRFKWIMKKEIRHIPLVGTACDAAGHIFIDRSNAIKAKHSIEKAEERLRNGSSVVIFPEGSRTRNGEVGKFKRGAFSIAADLHLPVVPITIRGAFEALPTRSLYIKPGTIEMIIHKPIDTTNLTHDNLNDFIAQTRDIIANEL
ncbi:MAG TPA: lysophospholipid acyltransferase family protein [Paludibacteraceae bacterium]|nr:lysophospholipid acyltransferase family protein [Paludibacteraceae bacterium]